MKETKIICDLCGKAIIGREHFISQDIRGARTGLSFKIEDLCLSCAEAFFNLYNQLKQKKDSGPKIKIRCEKCKSYFSKENLKKHDKSCKLPKKTITVTCPNCLDEFDKRGFHRHQESCKREKTNKPVKIPSETMDRLREYRKNADIGSEGRMRT